MSFSTPDNFFFNTNYQEKYTTDWLKNKQEALMSNDIPACFLSCSYKFEGFTLRCGSKVLQVSKYV
jgi:hypothetical protein